MRKVHLISVTEPVIFDLALAIRSDEGYAVSVSGNGLTEEMIARLHEAGCTCHGDGWFPEKITNDTHIVILGASVNKDNPELIRAKELGLLTQSVPEFIFGHTKSKTRVVVAGDRGKSGVLAMMAYVLKKYKQRFDYVLTSALDTLPDRISLQEEARIALIEGDESLTSSLSKRFHLEFYRPHIAVITNLMWSEDKDHNSLEEYLLAYKNFVTSIEREGKLIYFEQDRVLKDLGSGVREDITSIPYDGHEWSEGENGLKILHTRYGDFPVYTPDEYFLYNLNAARLACRQLGVKDADFYQAVSEYSLSLQK
ncbi:UDP-N-acetylmuramate--alanine ligase [Parabacteroides sp. OttesenSCG-928-G06]|nr:UDP-N-acetylmuramate--alanine ligase [Parabacteroides sp. OttesenSCG-928-G06]